ncbi:autoinducer 2 ABC transporter substrate-binding protein [Chelatococcus daeguensis]|uniref:LacI family transcriptional regulator n=2 Tax=Chelatococcus TaxID=28209 RepID=A0AAC9P0I8_9HYPH|nr:MULTISPECIES: autoinducer 2 ABC transporter substrate-binding protein [Chelatococcus]APF39649.1 LacI family transcriptional regulator [Chelatococcus daeguensis]KZE29384.1 LacI family transcriptional regulator [Chelatococcus daeguensis]MBM3083876.1 autoinducer 2 ABC transporter substrate-binding protein [Chelatococcus daeguensis]CUA86932.1 ABC-type sugar transport system, periplasmic component, contains N-terminal xre family HTH domain [Chelatococcus sambhunathii]
MRKLLVAAVAASLSIASAFSAAAQETGKVGVVVKIGGIPWFNAMEAGIKERGAKLGVDAFMVGPTSADPALQVRAIEDLIAQGVKVIGVVPNDATVLEPVLSKAQSNGIIVITHESPGQKGADWNFELASATGFGEAHAELLAEKMGGKGKYAVFVGSLTVPLHNAWADAAIAHLKEKYPEMQLVGERYGVAEDVDASRKTALDLISAHPDLKGFLAFGSQGPIGAGRAVEERRKVGEIFVLGPFSPGQGRRLIKSDAISGGFMWNPKQAGEVFVTLADRLMKGGKIEAGDEIEGLGKVTPDGNNLIVDQLVAINKDTVDRLADMGL